MKKLKKSLIFAAYGLIAATALTSCLNSDDDSDYLTPRVMTDTEANLYLAEISGTYSGDLMCSYEDVVTGKRGVDTVDVEMTIGYDKTVTVENMPDSVFQYFIYGNSPVRAVAENATTTHGMSMKMGSFIVEEDKNGAIVNKYFFLDAKNSPYTFDYTTVENGEPVFYPVKVKFTDYFTDPYNYVYTYSSMGAYNQKDGTIAVQFILESVDTKNSDVRQNALMLFKGKR